MLDLNDRTISFSLNGELMLDVVGGECAFTDLPAAESGGYLPAFTLGNGQKIRLIFGQDINALKFFTLCGLQVSRGSLLSSLTLICGPNRRDINRFASI